MIERSRCKLSIVLILVAVLLSVSALAAWLYAAAQLVAQTITAISTAALAGAALYGLTIWRRQIKAPREYEIACRLYSNVARLQRLMAEVREPADSDLMEMIYSVMRDQTELPFPTVSYSEVLRAVYRNRQNELQDALEPLQEELFTVEAVLGPDITNPLREVLKKCAEVLSLLAACAVSKKEEADPANIPDQRRKEKLLGLSDSETDRFWSELDASLAEILAMITQHK